MTLEDIERIPGEFLRVSEIAPILNADAHTVYYIATNKPELLNFAVITMGKRVRIPKRAFIHFCKYGNADAAIEKRLFMAVFDGIEKARRDRVERKRSP